MTKLYPVLPLRDIVLFPGHCLPVMVGRPATLAAVEHAAGSEMLCIAQRDPAVETPTADDLYEIGTLALVQCLATLPGGAVHLLAVGTRRGRLAALESGRGFLEAAVELLDAASPPPVPDPGAPARVSRLQALLEAALTPAERAMKMTELLGFSAPQGADGMALDVRPTTAPQSPA